MCKWITLMGKIVAIWRSIANAKTREAAAPPHFSAHVDCGQTVAHLSNCWALVKHLFKIYVTFLTFFNVLYYHLNVFHTYGVHNRAWFQRRVRPNVRSKSTFATETEKPESKTEVCISGQWMKNTESQTEISFWGISSPNPPPTAVPADEVKWSE